MKNQAQKAKSLIKKTQLTPAQIQQQKDAKHRMYVLDQWLTTETTYHQDLQAALQIIKRKVISQQLIESQQKINNLFPEFQGMRNLSKNMIEIISSYKSININNVMIGKRLQQMASFYKIYLQYFKKKTDMKKIYDQVQKQNPAKLKIIQTDLRDYFAKLYSNLNNSKNPKQNITILDCLERPLYRLFKYHLLIDSYLKKLPKQHPDYQILKKARLLFVEIGDICNNSFTQQQKQDLKYKLQQLYGRSLPQNSQYKSTMSAQTLYFPCKLYVFSNLVIISKTEKMIGFRQQKLYSNLGVDEFSFITYKKDLKYFKNILILCGIYECTHFFLPDKGTRLQIYQLLNKIIQQQKLKAFQKRQHKEVKDTNKISFMVQSLQQNKIQLTGLKIQVIDVDLRSIGYFNSDTAFIISFNIPEYIDDQATFLKNSTAQINPIKNHTSIQDQKFLQGQERMSLAKMTKQQLVIVSRIGPVSYKNFQRDSQFNNSVNYCSLNQRLQINLSELILLHKQLRSDFPQVNFPQIDPLSKDFNFYTQSKKKTKSFQMRTLLIEEYLNYVFRHPTIMSNILMIVRPLKINQQLWNYVRQRSTYIGNQKRDQKLSVGQTLGNKYDHNHCSMCRKSIINMIYHFQLIRNQKIQNRINKPANYCFNYYNLIRNNLLSLHITEFNTLQRMLLYVNYFEGRLDYPFLYKKLTSKKHKTIKIWIPKVIPLQLRQNKIDFDIFKIVSEHPTDQKTTVGMLLCQICRDIQIYNMFDYRIILQFNDQQRILDQDQLLINIIKKYQIEYQQQQFSQSQSNISIFRNSTVNDSIIKTANGFFGMIKNAIPINTNKAKLLLKKVVWLSVGLQISSIRNSFQRAKLITAEVLQRYSTSNVNLPIQNWAEICALYYIIINFKNLDKFKADKSIFRCCTDVLPKQKYELIKNKIFQQKVINVIIKHKQMMNLNDQTQIFQSIYQRLLTLAYQNFRINTYFVPICAKSIPNSILLDNQTSLTGDCFIGVNHNQIIVVRDRKNPKQTIRMPIQDVEITHSVYSLFLTYKRESSFEQKKLHVQEIVLRFDSKMLHSFFQLCEKYKLIKSKFSSINEKSQKSLSEITSSKKI